MTDIQKTPDKSLLAGPKVLLEGPPGSGKTYSIGTLVDWAQENEKEVFVLFAENGLSSLLGYWTSQNKPIPPCLHWHVCLTRPISLDQLMTSVDNLGKLSIATIESSTDTTRGGDNNAFYKILGACHNFTDDSTGQSYGSFTKFGTDKIIVIDSLTPICDAALRLTVGSKMAFAGKDYGPPQQTVMSFIRILADSMEASVVLIAHVIKDEDKLTGASKIVTHSVGKAISQLIPRYFPDTIYTLRDGTKFYWDTAISSVDTKATHIPIASKLPADFRPLMDTWKQRGGK